MKLITISFLLLTTMSCSQYSVEKLDEAPRPPVEKQDKIQGVKLTFSPMVDILFVIDNSGSMLSHQVNLARQVLQFTSKITQNLLLDYHIGVLTSSMRNRGGHLIGTPPWVDRMTANGDVILASRMQPGTNGDYDERFFEPIAAALSAPLVDGINAGFYRPEAFLAVVFITDTGIDGPLSPREAFDFLLNLKKGDASRLAAYAALVPPNNPSQCQTDSEWGSGGIQRFMEFLDYFSDFSGGPNYFDLCSPTFGEDLAKIGADLESRIEMFIPLKEFPVLSTMKVYYGRQMIPQHEYYGWSYNADRVGILLGRGLELEEQEGAALSIDYIPAKLKRN